MGKKSIKKDFQKVKLKVGRKLKRQNDFTGINFKSKKIVLQEQFQKLLPSSKGGEVKLYVKYVIKQLNHPKPRERRNALAKIHYLLTSNELSGHFSSIIPAVLRLFVDMDCDVRKEALQLIKSLFQALSSDQARGYTNLLQRYVSLAMTHLNPRIRSHSLNFFDFILDQFPDFVSSSEKLVNHFLGLVSQRKDEKSPRTLSMLPLTGGLTAQEWRVKVLERLVKLFDANISRLTINQVRDRKEEEHPYFIKSGSFRLVKQATPLPGPTLSLDINELDEGVSLLSDPDRLVQFQCDVIELLVESWDEASLILCANDEVSGSSMKKDAGKVIEVIVKCLSSCANWVNLLETREHYRVAMLELKQLVSSAVQMALFPSFPLQFNMEHVSSSEESDSSCVKLNLSMCEIFVMFVLDTVDCSSVFANRILEFLLEVVEKEIICFLPSLLKTLKRFLLCESIDNSMCYPHIEALFSSSQNVSPASDYRKAVSEFFLDLILNQEFQYYHNTPALHAWLKQLPGELLYIIDYSRYGDSLCKNFVERVARIPAGCHPSFAEGLQNSSHELMNLLMSSDECVQYVAVTLCSRIPSWSDHHFCKLFNLCKTMSIPTFVLCKLINRLQIRLVHEIDPGFPLVSFKSFLLNLAVGINSNTGDSILTEEGQVAMAISQAVPFGLSSYEVLPSRRGKRHAELLDLAIRLLNRVDSQYAVQRNTCSFLVSFMQKRLRMPVFTAISVLKLFGAIVLGRHPINTEYSLLCTRVADLTIALYLYEAALVQVDARREFLEIHSVLDVLHRHTYNFGEITTVMLSKLDAIESMEDTTFYGDILCELRKCCPLTKDDVPNLSSLLNGMQTIFGEEITSLNWWMRLRNGHA